MAEFSGRELTCVRGERTVFVGLDFGVGNGAALVLTGANGAGKSSLLRMMAGLLPPAAGTLRWDGEDIREDAEAHCARLRYVGHADAIKPALTVAENLDAWAALHGGAADARTRTAAALDRFGILRLADVPGRYLSAGQRRRLALARLLVADAPLWLLDEPRTALDHDGLARLDAAIAEHRAAGGMAVLALHGSERPPASVDLDLGQFGPDPDDDEGYALDSDTADAC